MITGTQDDTGRTKEATRQTTSAKIAQLTGSHSGPVTVGTLPQSNRCFPTRPGLESPELDSDRSVAYSTDAGLNRRATDGQPDPARPEKPIDVRTPDGGVFIGAGKDALKD